MSGQQHEHLSADGQPVEVGRKFWDNNLRVVQVTKLGTRSQPYADSGCEQTWHDTTGGSSDTMTGHMRHCGRLARRFEGKDAEDYEPGTEFAATRTPSASA